MRTVQVGLLAALLLAGCGDGGGNGLETCEHGDSQTQEVCDGFDNNCDGSVDEGLPTATWWPDADGDGYGDAKSGEKVCGTPVDRVDNGDDCNDTNAAFHPGADEICDDKDNDCDGLVDSDDGDIIGASEYFVDADRDGEGVGWSFYFCQDPGGGWSTTSDDCDDTDASIGNTLTWYRDSDGDGYGDDAATLEQCEGPSDYITAAGDCDDGDATVNPSAREVCHDLVDNDCDGTANGCLPWSGSVSIDDADFIIKHGATGASMFLSGADIDGDGVNELIGATPTGGTYSYGQIFVYDGLKQGDGLTSSDAKLTITGTGSTGGAYLGYCATGIGDTDGDGYDEIVTTDRNGYATLFDGPFARSTLSTGYATLFSDGPDASESWSVFTSGDFDSDSRAELIVGDPNYSYDATNSGMVWIVDEAARLGSTSLKASYTSVIGGTSASAAFGSTVATLGDMDGDGTIELGIAAANSSDYRTTGGAMYVFDGATVTATSSSADADVIIYGSATSGYLGWDVGGSGDFNGDGYADLFVSAVNTTSYGTTGAAFLFEGPPKAIGSGITDASADIIFYPTGSQPYFGYRVDVAGDLDEDGRDDVIVGHLGNSKVGTYAGAALIWYGDGATGSRKDTTADVAILPTSTDNYLGWDVSGVGDISGDGIDDVVVGWYGYHYIFGFLGGSN